MPKMQPMIAGHLIAYPWDETQSFAQHTQAARDFAQSRGHDPDCMVMTHWDINTGYVTYETKVGGLATRVAETSDSALEGAK